MSCATVQRMTEIGIRDLRQYASQHLRAVAAGETLTVTDRGRPVAELVPSRALDQATYDAVERHGLIAPTRRRRDFRVDIRWTEVALTVEER